MVLSLSNNKKTRNPILRKFSLRNVLWFMLFPAFMAPGNADQTLIPNAEKAQQLFWKQLYPGPSYTLYCGERFNGKNDDLAIEHVYPIEWIAEFLGCGSIDQCRSESKRFNRIEADLHNYYPVLMMIRRVRSDFKYGEVAGEFREFFECDFEHDVRTSTIEPREIARGNIARSLFYMHREYGLPVDQQTMEMLLIWHEKDPPSNDEKRRNNIISKIQGTRNSFIDHPENAASLVKESQQPVSGANPDSSIVETSI